MWTVECGLLTMTVPYLGNPHPDVTPPFRNPSFGYENHRHLFKFGMMELLIAIDSILFQMIFRDTRVHLLLMSPHLSLSSYPLSSFPLVVHIFRLSHVTFRNILLNRHITVLLYSLARCMAHGLNIFINCDDCP